MALSYVRSCYQRQRDHQSCSPGKSSHDRWSDGSPAGFWR